MWLTPAPMDLQEAANSSCAFKLAALTAKSQSKSSPESMLRPKIEGQTSNSGHFANERDRASRSKIALDLLHHSPAMKGADYFLAPYSMAPMHKAFAGNPA